MGPSKYFSVFLVNLGFAVPALCAQGSGTILNVAFETYLGGSQYEYLAGVAVDSAGNAYVAGSTGSTDLPTLNALYPAFQGGLSDIVVAKYSPAGKLIYCTYMGGNDRDQALGIAVDAAGNAYVVGQTSSANFPSVNAIPQQTAASASVPQAFVFELDPTGQKLLYSTTLGSGQAQSVAVDSAGGAYVTGSTGAATFPVVGGLQSTYGGSGDAFVMKIAPGGGQLVYSTFLGGSKNDSATGIAVDAGGNAYVVGNTQSPDFPVKNGYQMKLLAGTGPTNQYYGPSAGFIAKLNPAGSALVYSTFFSGSTSDNASAIAIDAAGSAYVTGSANSTDFPVLNAFQPFLWPLCVDGIHDSIYVAKFNPAGNALAYSTLIDGSCLDDSGSAIAVDAQGSAYVTGRTDGWYFPTTGALPANLAGPQFPGSDGMFVLKLAPSGSAVTYASLIGGPGYNDSFAGGAAFAYAGSSNGIALDQAGDAYVAGITQSPYLPPVNAQQASFGGVFDGFLVKLTATSGGSAVPVTSSIAPAAANINSAGVTVQVSGSQFLASSVVQWNAVAVPTTFVSATQLTATIPAADLTLPGAQWVNVSTPGPGGGMSSYQQFTVNGNLPPFLLNISTVQLTAGGPAATIYVTGCNIGSYSAVQWNGVALATSVYTGPAPSWAIGSTSVPGGCAVQIFPILQATVPASLLVAGPVTIAIANPAPGGGTSSTALTVLPAPTIRGSNALLNSASYTSSIVPGGLASLFGANFSAQSCLSYGLSTTLCGVSVTMNGIAVPLLYVGGSQVNLQIPWELQGQASASVQVLANGVSSPAVTTGVVTQAPAIFTLNQAGTGQGAILLAGTATVANSANPVTAGNAIEIYMTGLGAVHSQPVTGASAGNQSTTLLTPTVTIGGVSANVLFSGLAPTFVGLYQVNVQIPSGVTAGSQVPVVVTMNGAASNVATIAVH
jgi:uncharacterized protein (TIGR03437 family)